MQLDQQLSLIRVIDNSSYNRIENRQSISIVIIMYTETNITSSVQQVQSLKLGPSPIQQATFFPPSSSSKSTYRLDLTPMHLSNH